MKFFLTRKLRQNAIASVFVRGRNAGGCWLQTILRHALGVFECVPGIFSKSGSNSLKRNGFGGYRIQTPSEMHDARTLKCYRTAFLRYAATLFGCGRTLPGVYHTLSTVSFLFIGLLCFGAPASAATEKSAPKSLQKGTKANKGSSADKASAKSSTKGAMPPPDVASPDVPASDAEPKEIKKLKSYCKHHSNDWEGFYNLGIEQYKLMDYAAAQQSFAQALQNCSDPKEQEKIFYNLGNAGFRFSQSQSVDQQVLGFKESLQNYENALAIDKEAKDTQHNIEVVKRYLKRAEKQQQQEQQNKKDDKKNDNKKLTNMEKDNDSSDNKDKDKDKDKDDKDDKDNQKDQQDDSGDKNVDLEQKEMDNILNRAKKVEKMLPPSSLNPQSGGKDPVIRDW